MCQKKGKFVANEKNILLASSFKTKRQYTVGNVRTSLKGAH